MYFDSRTDPYWYYNNSLYNYTVKGGYGRMEGGMANSDKFGNIVSQKKEGKHIKNYVLTPENIDTEIINNDNYDDDEKKRIIDTEYDELLSLKLAYERKGDEDKSNYINELLKHLDNTYEGEIEKKERKNRNQVISEKIEKMLYPDYKTDKGVLPLFKKAQDEAEKVASTELFNDFKTYLKDIDFTNEEQYNYQTLKGRIGEENYSNLLDFLKINGVEDGTMNETLNNLLETIYQTKGKQSKNFNNIFTNIIRGNESEKIISENNILLKTYTGDYTKKYNSKDNEFYIPDFFTNVKKDLTKIMEDNKITIDKDIIDDVYKLIINKVKDYYPIDLRDKNNLYELKSRQTNVYNQNNYSIFNNTKYLDKTEFENIPYTIPININGKEIKIVYFFTPEKTNDGKINKIGMKIHYLFDGKDKNYEYKNTIPKGKYDIIWNDNTKYGNIFYNISNNIEPDKSSNKYKFKYDNRSQITTPIQNYGYYLGNHDDWLKRRYNLEKQIKKIGVKPKPSYKFGKKK